MAHMRESEIARTGERARMLCTTMQHVKRVSLCKFKRKMNVFVFENHGFLVDFSNSHKPDLWTSTGHSVNERQ